MDLSNIKTDALAMMSHWVISYVKAFFVYFILHFHTLIMKRQFIDHFEFVLSFLRASVTK